MTPSTYYYKHKKPTESVQEKETNLLGRIEQIACEYTRYGYRRITAQLKRENIIVNHKKVLRIMRESSLLCAVKRKWKGTTNSNHPYPRYPNLIRNMVIYRPNQIWVADITYIRILTAFVYLAVILDVFARKAVGYNLSKSLDTKLTLLALKMAVAERKPAPGCIHHSDQGFQYAAPDYVDELKKYGFQISMARKGNPYDNAMAESFMKTLKYEEVYLWGYRTIDEAVERIPFFIQEVYNKKRLHSALGYMPPEEYEMEFLKKNNLTGSCQLVTI